MIGGLWLPMMSAISESWRLIIFAAVDGVGGGEESEMKAPLKLATTSIFLQQHGSGWLEYYLLVVRCVSWSFPRRTSVYLR